MSLIPTADAGAPGANYFPYADGGILRSPTVLPSIDGSGGAAGLTIDNGGVTNPPGNAMKVVHFASATTAGGLVAGTYQVFMYSPNVGGNGISELMSGGGLGNNYTVLKFNSGGPMDAARDGKITGTGAPQVIACPSIVAGSAVNLAFVGGTAAAADVAITIVPNTSFSLTIPLGSVYNYTVVG